MPVFAPVFPRLPRRAKRHGVAMLLACALVGAPAEAIVIYGVGASGNTADPGTGAPWDAVGTFTNSGGTSVGNSCVYLGNGYVLTANHAGTTNWVSLGGATYARDTSYAPVQIASGVDAKVLRLTGVSSGVQGVALYGGSAEVGAAVTLVGWGVGRNPADTDFGPAPLPITVDWGTGRDQRWGTNAVGSVLSGVNVFGYVYDALETTLDSTGGANEAGIANGDSGSGMFAFLDGKWQLVGLNTATSSNGGANTSTFGGLNPDTNVAVRISSYRSQITALVPEPAGFSLLALGAAALLLRRPGRRGRRGG